MSLPLFNLHHVSYDDEATLPPETLEEDIEQNITLCDRIVLFMSEYTRASLSNELSDDCEAPNHYLVMQKLSEVSPRRQ